MGIGCWPTMPAANAECNEAHSQYLRGVENEEVPEFGI